MTLDLAGKMIVVTGAASGIGRAVALLASRCGAAGVLLTDRDAPGCRATEAEMADHAAVHVADLEHPSAPAAIADAAIAHFGRIDGLVNAAGLTTRASLATGTEADWETLFAVNARAPFFLMQAAVGDMRARGAPGAIVNILSINAHCGLPDLAIYAATKGALLTLTKNAANAHMADHIRVNGINLGWALTEAEHRMQAGTLGQGETWAEAAAARLPLGRLILPEEAARHAVWLLSDASAPMSGIAYDLEQKVLGAPA